jgi:hypothetical protein
MSELQRTAVILTAMVYAREIERQLRLTREITCAQRGAEDWAALKKADKERMAAKRKLVSAIGDGVMVDAEMGARLVEAVIYEALRECHLLIPRSERGAVQ